MEIGIPVEVEGTFGEFYSGVVYGIDSTDEYHVNLLDSSNSTIVMEVHIPPSSMRLPPDVAAFPFDPMQGQEVDVLIPCCSNPSESSADSESETQPITKLSAWWPGQVKKVAGSFVIVELASAFSTEAIPERPNSHDVVVINNRISIPLPSSILKTDVVEKHQLRPRSHQTNFDPASFHMHNIDVPDALVPYCREPANYVQFARRCGLPILVCMAPDSLRPSSPIHRDDGETYELRARLLVISTDVSTVKRAAVIDNTFIEMLQQKVQILQQTEELSRKLEASRMPAPFVEFLRVPESLIPQAIGHQGSNIRKASAVEGIISIKLDRLECTFRISGKSTAVRE
ncbi:Fragile X mental retardation protein 1 B [Fasciola hepatica]|uniref:Fragile X mental retardation protein 1 B n=1 Tax=Fasciola hepatica TaxID=6192 RepID=A0A4E0QW54_FASHE|nr:Fragile X mental retardation protein 1 B [Fasciola hepatica]